MGEDNRINRAAMTLEGLEALAAAGIPYLDGGIVRSRGKKLGIPGEDDRENTVAMALEDLEALAAAGIPYLDGGVV